jgi:Zn-dependent protease/predicted transcriptional regulator
LKGNLNIGTYLGIPVKIHWTFGLLILFVGYVGVTNGLNGKEILAFGLYMLVLFFCVVLHEYGHAIMARKYGVKTKDIILSPIGGVARLESIPEEPYKELFIALAGPLVNVIIAVTLSIITLSIYSGGIFPSSESLELLKYPSEFIRFVIVMNIALFVFNLVPAFPMDGGRVLRSLLAIKIGRSKATRTASLIGRILAIGFIVFGLLNSHILLTIIGVFIYVTAGSENKSVMITEVLSNTKAMEIVNPNYTIIDVDDPIELPMNIYLRGGEKNFLVTDHTGAIVGVIPELFLIDAIKNKVKGLVAGQRMSDKYTSLPEDSTLMEVYKLMSSQGMAIIGIVNQEGERIGIIDREGVSRFLEIRFSNSKAKKSPA